MRRRGQHQLNYEDLSRAVANRGDSRAYSLVEVLIAGALLLVAISAAAVLARALIVQDQSTGYAIRALNAQEQAAKLWQLGVVNITNILPERCSASNPPPANSIYLQFNSTTSTIAGVGTVELLNPLRIVFHSGSRAGGALVYRTNDVTVVRPSIR